MGKVKNKKAVSKIAVRCMLSRKSRSFIAIAAIALTSVLFTTLFTITGAMVEKNQEETMRRVGGSAHAGYKYLTKEEYEKAAADKELKEISYRIYLAAAENKELNKVRSEMSYYEDLDAEFCFCYPEEGHMPREKYEIAASDLTLEALGIPCETGQKVPLEFTVGEKKYRQEFILSGWFHGDRVSAAQPICVSKEYVEEIAPPPTESYKDGNLLDAGDIAGRYMADFNFKSSWNLEGQLEKLSQRLGFENMAAGLNWAYMGSKPDPEMTAALAVILAVILLSGYLIIYNIFYINVYSDIRFLGLLKTIGTTGRQLRRIVRCQAYILSAAGIPLGLMAGYFVGKGLFPILMVWVSMGDTFTAAVTVNPWVFLGSAVFSLLTVYMSCIKPCRIASKVSPVEAVRFTEGKEGKHTGKEKKTKTITMRSFAMANINRNKKKVVIVVLSLSISLILLNSVYGLVSGFDMDAYVESESISDYLVTDATTDNAAIPSFSRVVDGVKKEFMEELQKQPGIEECSPVYFKIIEIFLNDEENQRFEERIWSRMDEVFSYLIQLAGEQQKEYLESIRKERRIDTKIYGIDELVFDKLALVEGGLDWEKFSTGKYVITNRTWASVDESQRVNFYDVGEKVTLTDKKGESREYEVMAVAEMPYAASMQSNGVIDLTYILPAEEFFWYCGESQPMKLLFNVEDAEEASVAQWMENYCMNIEPDLIYTSKATIVAEFSSLKNTIILVGGMLSFILAMIGILNFINTIVTGILARKQEFAMIEAVGMTGKQLLHMLMWEGGYYAAFTLISAALAAGILDATLIRSMENSLFYFKWNFTILPILLCMPFMVLVVLFVPVLAYKRMCRTSVVERIRVTE